MNISAPPPSKNPVLTGHDEAVQQVTSAFASGRMPHAWLITGMEGIGKATLAWHMAHHALSRGENPIGRLDLSHATARLVAGRAHPDLFVLDRPLDEKTGRPKDTIPAEEARKLSSFLHMTSTYGGWRVAIIDGAHALNRFGQNAILKAVEEPPPRCLILLTATSAGVLVPTIRSRCRVLKLRPLDGGVMKSILARCGPDLPPEQMERLIMLSGGSAGLALRIAETGALPLYEELEEILDSMPKADMVKVHAFAERFGRKAESEIFEVMAYLLTERLRRKVLELAGTNNVSSLFRAMSIWDSARLGFAMAVESSLDKKLAFVNVMNEIRRQSAAA